jgi:hypothetical protein
VRGSAWRRQKGCRLFPLLAHCHFSCPVEEAKAAAEDLAAAVRRADKDAASKEQLAALWDSAFSWLLSRVTGLYAMQMGWLS